MFLDLQFLEGAVEGPILLKLRSVLLLVCDYGDPSNRLNYRTFKPSSQQVWRFVFTGRWQRGERLQRLFASDGGEEAATGDLALGPRSCPRLGQGRSCWGPGAAGLDGSNIIHLLH